MQKEDDADSDYLVYLLITSRILCRTFNWCSNMVPTDQLLIHISKTWEKNRCLLFLFVSLVHELQSVHGVQSGQLSELHSLSSESSPAQRYARLSGSTHFRFRFCRPPPHVALHSVHSVHSVHTGHSAGKRINKSKVRLKRSHPVAIFHNSKEVPH